MKIERSIEIAAPRACVWKALTTPVQFCKWFGCCAAAGATAGLEFSPGSRVELVSTSSNCSGMAFGFEVIELTPEHTMAWKWHPGKVMSDPNQANEALTTVRFHLEESGDRTVVTVIETGFDLLSAGLAAAAFRENDGGWAHQLQQLENYMEANSEVYAN